MAASQKSGSGQAPARQFTSKDPELYSHELDWWLNCRDAACGFRSSMSGTVATIERGGHSGGGGSTDAAGSYIHPYHDGQTSFGKGQSVAFARDRKMRRRWQHLSDRAQTVFAVHYTGAWPSGSNDSDARQRWPLGVESRLGQMAAVTLYLAAERDIGLEGRPTIARVLKACEKGNDAGLRAWKVLAEKEIRIAHRSYYEVAVPMAERDVLRDRFASGALAAELEGHSVNDRARADHDGVYRQRLLMVVR